jgi:hypothetical protein
MVSREKNLIFSRYVVGKGDVNTAEKPVPTMVSAESQ